MYERMESNRLGWKFSDGSIKYSKQKWQAFWEYFERTWIDGYGVEIWNVHGMANELVARTNNASIANSTHASLLRIRRWQHL
ncbi:hypothetical protein PHPALM_29033 [Phytophthora palmivora]|uniref:Uncharacterized protein n=1 Tax=Phytophthora palmivora TaxID=4796 RepID=A0A2P4X8K6_9STRA|nr:hypothetical protein PHPALM_29033 [Phytophthora palmivora]